METLYRHDGLIDDSTPGWEQEITRVKDTDITKLIGPVIDTKELAFRFMRLSFEYAASAYSHGGIFFCDEKGTKNTDDYLGLDPGEGFSEYVKVFYGREKEVTSRPFFQFEGAIKVRNIVIEAASDQDAADWCDDVYRQLPPLHYSPPVERLANIPKTMAALKDGTPWRVVLLGDSIINDTFCSTFQALIKRLYPTSDFRYINSVHGSTGCGVYSEQKSFNDFVLSYRPNLLIVGGISNMKDFSVQESVACMRKVITMAQGQANAEVMVLSGPLGRAWREIDPKCIDEPADEKPYIPPLKFWEAMASLANEMNVEYQNQGAIWREYLLECGVSPNIFHRDRHHGNIRGEQIVARMLEAYFRT